MVRGLQHMALISIHHACCCNKCTTCRAPLALTHQSMLYSLHDCMNGALKRLAGLAGDCVHACTLKFLHCQIGIVRKVMFLRPGPVGDLSRLRTCA
jgi:hypothetical protein